MANYSNWAQQNAPTNPYMSLSQFGAPSMGINPAAPNPFMFSNGMDPTSGTAPTNWSSTLGQPASPFIPQMGAQGVGLDPKASSGSIWDSFLSKDGNQGWGNAAAGAAGGIFNAFMGMKQYGLAKDTLEQNKQQFAQNFDAQRSMTNSRMEDRQRARIGSSGGTNANYQSVGDYMNKNGVK